MVIGPADGAMSPCEVVVIGILEHCTRFVLHLNALEDRHVRLQLSDRYNRSALRAHIGFVLVRAIEESILKQIHRCI